MSRVPPFVFPYSTGVEAVEKTCDQLDGTRSC